MKDRMKTFLLTLLFVLSIFLSKQLWFGNIKNNSLTSIASLENKEELGTEEIDKDLIKPYKVLLNFNKKNHTVLYKENDLWKESKEYIKEGLENSNVKVEEIDKEEYEELLDKRSIVYYFPQKLTTYILAKTLEVERVNHITEDIQKFEEVYISLSNDEKFLVLSYENKYFKIFELEIDIFELIKKFNKIEALEYTAEEVDKKYTNYHGLRNTMGIDSTIYTSYNMVEKYPYIFVSDQFGKDLIKSAREYSQRFFNINIDFIGEVIEDNDSILHIYDQQVLKYSRDGVIEYFNPLQEKNQENNLLLSLNRASEFLYKNISQSDKIHLSEYKKINYKSSGKSEISKSNNGGYRFIYRYSIHGLELKDINDEENYVYIDVYNNEVQSFREIMDSNTHTEIPEKDALSGFELLNDENNYEEFKNDYMKKYDISKLSDEEKTRQIYESFIDMSLYYIVDEEKGIEILKPVWSLKNKFYEYIFDLYSGELIKKIELE